MISKEDMAAFIPRHSTASQRGLYDRLIGDANRFMETCEAVREICELGTFGKIWNAHIRQLQEYRERYFNCFEKFPAHLLSDLERSLEEMELTQKNYEASHVYT